MHHRLASNPVRCDLVLYEDRSQFVLVFALLLLCSYDVMF